MIPLSHIHEATQQVIDAVASRAVGVLIRNPATDTRFPDTSDLDFVVLSNVDDLCSERMHLKMQDSAGLMTDLTWLPWELVRNAERAATCGLLPHRVLDSCVVWDASGALHRLCEEIRSHMYDIEVQKKRMTVLLAIGFETVREIGFTWDFPALALFWLHMTFPACLSALVDGLGHFCPNVYTRPFDYLSEIDSVLDPGTRNRCVEALHLDVDPVPMMNSLRRIHAHVVARFPEPVWPSAIRSGTRFEYRYWLSPREIEWRINVAGEMLRRRDSVATIFYLRFCAYALARIPMVHACAVRGEPVSFLRPEQAVFPALQRLAPFILEDLNCIFSGGLSLDREDVRRSISMLIDFRDDCIACLRSRGVSVPELQAWEPYGGAVGTRYGPVPLTAAK